MKIKAPPSNIVYFGCKAWEPSRDAACKLADPERGLYDQPKPTKEQNARALGLVVVDGRYARLRRRGKARHRAAPCVVCGGRPPVNGYCEGCSRAHKGFRGPRLIRTVTTAAQRDDAKAIDAERAAEAKRQTDMSKSFAERHHAPRHATRHGA